MSRVRIYHKSLSSWRPSRIKVGIVNGLRSWMTQSSSDLLACAFNDDEAHRENRLLIQAKSTMLWGWMKLAKSQTNSSGRVDADAIAEYKVELI